MNIKELLGLINQASTEEGGLEDLFKSCLDDEALLSEDLDHSMIKEYILNIHESKKTDFGNKLSVLENISRSKMFLAAEYKATDYIACAKKIGFIISNLIQLYNSAMKQEQDLLDKAKAAEKVEIGDVQRISQSMNDLKSDINRANAEIAKIANDIKQQSQDFDSKVFQVLLNTVTILGIFVAIAFTGFGTITIFTDISIETWMQSTEVFIKNTFILLVTSLLAYNLLLLLIYFVYRLSRPLISIKNRVGGKKTDLYKENGFCNSMNLLPFLIIDAILLILVIALFVWCVFFI